MSDETSLAPLVLEVQAQQRQSWQRGERIPAESYFLRHPLLGSDTCHALEVIYYEVLLREELGEKPTLDEYTTRFPALAADLEPLFEVHQAIEKEAFSPLTNLTSSSLSGYEILGELGRGGMGIVYKARHKGLDRLIALKMARDDGDEAASWTARFQTEQEAVARLQHPNIVQIFEVGVCEGRAYAALEFVNGGSLDRLLDGRPIPPADAAALVETLARAVHHAHQRGIVHRDLKPANILLALEEAPGPSAGREASAVLKTAIPKIADFGLAKKLGGAGPTQTGQILGTPSYMAPEQAVGQREIGPACDVYALGALLYECLTGRPPFNAATALDTLFQVLHDEPVSPRRLDARIPQDLETICLHCLARQPRRRFASAAALADDLRRFQEGRPITARRAGMGERVLKAARRHPAVAALVLAGLLAVVAAGAGLFLHLHRLGNALQDTATARDAEEEQRRLADERAETAQRHLYTARLNLVQLDYESANLARVLDGLRLTRPAKDEEDRRGFEWYYFWKQCHRDKATRTAHDGTVRALALSPDGKTLASAAVDGAVVLWDLPALVPRATLRGQGGTLFAVAFAPDGRTLATGGGSAVTLWDVAKQQRVATLGGHKSLVRSVVFSPNGQVLASSSDDGALKIWNVARGEEISSDVLPDGDHALSLAFSSSGKTIALGGVNASLHLWDVTGRRLLHTRRSHRGPVWAVAFSPDGTLLASGSYDGALLLSDPDNSEPLRRHEGHASGINALVWAADGKHVITGSNDQTARVWNIAGGEQLRLRGHLRAVMAVALASDGQTLYTAGGQRLGVNERGGVIKAWDLPAHSADTLRGHDHWVMGLAFAPDSRTLASASVDHSVRLWDVQTGQELARMPGVTGTAYSVAFSRNGTLLAAAGSAHRDNKDAGGEVFLWDVATRKARVAFPRFAEVPRGLAFAPDGDTLAVGYSDGTVRLWDTADGSERRVLRGHEDAVRDVAFSPDGTCLATASSDKTVRLWDPASGEIRAVLKGHTEGVAALAFAPDGRALATASADGTVRVWDVATGEERRTLLGHSSPVYALAFSPDGRRLASTGRDQVLRLWDVATGDERAAFKGHRGGVWSLAFAADGRTLATGGEDHLIQLWRAAEEEEVEGRP